MISRQSTHIIYQVQQFILIILTLVAMGSLSLLLIRGILALFPDQLYPLAIGLLLYMAATVVLISFLHTISYIPSRLASAFDPIKNDIASGSISSQEELGIRITEFLVSFYDFAFLDIAHAFVHTPETGIISHERLEGARLAMEEFGMLDMSQTLDDIIRAGKITEGGREFHLYILPVKFGDRWLGYVGIMSHRRIGRFMRRFLSELENNFLDDQLMHVSRLQN